jgi:hypothetical protein
MVGTNDGEIVRTFPIRQSCINFHTSNSIVNIKTSLALANGWHAPSLPNNSTPWPPALEYATLQAHPFERCTQYAPPVDVPNLV